MVVILFVLLIPGQWIFVALGVSGIAGIILGSGADYLTTVGTITWNTTNNFVLSGSAYVHVHGRADSTERIEQQFL